MGREVTWRSVYPNKLAHSESDDQVYDAAWLANAMEDLLAAERRANAALEATVKALREALCDCSYFGHLSSHIAEQLIADAVDRVLSGEGIKIREVVDAQLTAMNERHRAALTGSGKGDGDE